MSDRQTMDFYIAHIQQLESEGADLLSFNCPFVACGREIKTANIGPGEFSTPLSICPHCEQMLWKVIQHGRACGLIPSRLSERSGAIVGSCGPLTLPLPDNCSNIYASGWAYADGFLSNWGDLAAEGTPQWHQDKANGFWDRLAAERDVGARSLDRQTGE